MKVSHEISIRVPTELVWAVTCNLEAWPQWTPTMRSVACLDRGPLAIGTRVRVRQPMQPVTEWVVIDLRPERSFVWEHRRPGWHFIARHTLLPQNEMTQNRLCLEARGTWAWMLWPVLRPLLRWALRQENEGLRQFCESSCAEGNADQQLHSDA